MRQNTPPQNSRWQIAVGINAGVVSFIVMEAAQVMTGWAREGPPPFLNEAMGDSPISVGPVHCDRSAEEWFRFPLLKEKEEFLEANLVQPDSVSEHVTDSEILKALDEIPSEFRSVVLLADVEEFAYREVAGILSIPIGTVMSRLSRGRALLRKRLVEVARSYGIGKSVQGDN